MELTGGEALVAQLEREGTQQIFGIPGVQLDYAVDALRRTPSIAFRTTRNEQATSYMADGFARTTGQPGVCMVVPGPGVLNALAGLSTAFACNSRVLCVAGQIHSQAVNKGFGLLHEIKNPSGVFDSVTKWHGMAMSPAEIPVLIREAHRQMASGRPGPVAVEVPQDVLMMKGEVSLIEPVAEDLRTPPDAALVRSAAEIIASAAFPVIYAGGGVLAGRAHRDLQRFAERIGAPVVMSENGRGALSDRHPLAFTSLAGRVLADEADVLIVVGSRFADSRAPDTIWSKPGQKYVYVNVDAQAGSSPRPQGIHLAADAGLALSALVDELDGVQARRLQLDTTRVGRLRAWCQEQIDAVEPQASFVRAIRAVLPDDGIFVNELTQVGYYARVAYPVYEPQTMISPGHQGTLGYGFPTGLGVAAGNPGKPVVAITGDGGFGWCLQELATARKYDLGLITVVFADGHFGNVRGMLNEQFGVAYNTELCNPDFVALAKSFGVPGERVEGGGPALEAALRRALARGGPALIEVPVGTMPSPWGLLRLKGKNPSAPPAPSVR
jgi:acetolactate synthase-1/2/3 large subunit